MQYTRPIVLSSRIAALRFYSAKIVDFDAVKLIAKKEKEATLVDVREPVEYYQGSIPYAINIPYKSNPNAWSLSEDEFLEKFGIEKPSKTTSLVFYCKAGTRSTAAANTAVENGYENVGNYEGSFDDWIKH